MSPNDERPNWAEALLGVLIWTAVFVVIVLLSDWLGVLGAGWPS